MNAHGTVHKYGDHVDTDVIIPARYLNTQSHKELAAHCMEDIDKNFIHNVKEGDIMVAGVNFGCGSSREHAPVAIKASGISCVIAANFARIFYRNAIPAGLARMSMGRFLLYTTIGAGLWNSILCGLGWYIGRNFSGQLEQKIAEYSGELRIAMLLVGVAAVGYLVYKGVKK